MLRGVQSNFLINGDGGRRDSLARRKLDDGYVEMVAVQPLGQAGQEIMFSLGGRKKVREGVLRPAPFKPIGPLPDVSSQNEKHGRFEPPASCAMKVERERL